MVRSEVFAYHESHQRYYRDPELIPSKGQGYKVVQKPNRALNATWNITQCSELYSFSVDGPVYSSLFPIDFPVTEERRGSMRTRTTEFLRN